MNPSKKQQPLETVPKEFTPEEIDRGIEKLQRRIKDVRELERLQHDDQRVDNTQDDVRETIREIFGGKSPEFNQHQYHRIQYGAEYMDMSQTEMQCNFQRGIPRTVAMLEGLVKRLQEKRADLTSDSTARVRSAFDQVELHPRIAGVAAELYKNGHYAEAVFNASKALINFVQEKSQRFDLDGTPLMTAVFSKNSPILAFNDLSDQSDLDEQEGMMHLFVGAALGIRNPRGHSFVEDSPERALEYIAFLSMLAARVDEARHMKA
jgi:uncharacterized protein (TIGR02391 family)